LSIKDHMKLDKLWKFNWNLVKSESGDKASRDRQVLIYKGEWANGTRGIDLR